MAACAQGVCLGMWIVDAPAWLQECVSKGHAVAVDPFEV